MQPLCNQRGHGQFEGFSRLPLGVGREGESGANAMTRILQAVAGVLVILTLTLVLSWPWFQTAVIRNSLHGYAAQVRRANCSLSEKERLLDRIEALDDRLREGATVGTLRWLESDRIVREMLSR